MTKLNTAIRDAIVNNACVKSGLDAQRQQITQDRVAWSNTVRRHHNGISDEEIEVITKAVMKAVNKLPDNMRRDTVHLTYTRSTESANIAGASVYLTYGEDKPTAQGKPTITADNPLTQQFYDIETRSKACEDARADLRAQVRAMVNSVTTVKRLLDMWPEAAELMPDNLAPTKTNLPAVVVSDLNALIGLPTPE